MRGVFVTGTDTGVGKTLAACALIHAVASRGVAAVPMKPIAAGATRFGSRTLNDDTVALLRASGRGLEDAEATTPILLREPMAPHIAAAREGRRITLDPVREALPRLAAGGDFLVVEGVGGFRVPLGDGLDTVDMACEIGLPVVIVVGLRLGCLNHALLTAGAVAAAGLPLAGWIANAIDPAMAVPEENIAALKARIPAVLLGRLPFAAAPDAAALAHHLDVRPLLEGHR
jgi:dethiobiotin synthetase